MIFVVKNRLKAMIVRHLLDETNMVDVEQSMDSAFPQKFELLQNYPNPFNSGTTIAFRLHGTMPVKLDVYNLLGQKVKTLIDATLYSGDHTTFWDGTTTAGMACPSGIYYCKLMAGSQLQSRKMIMVR